MESIIEPLLDFFKNNPYFYGFYYFGLILIFITATIFFFNFGILPIINGCLAVYHFFINVDQSMKKIVFIEKELRPNGGSTLKDSINLIQRKMLEHSESIVKIDEKHRILLNSMGLGVNGTGFFETNASGECVSITPKCSELAGLSEEELLGFNWILAIHPEDKEKVVSEWDNCTKLKRVFRMRFRYMNRKNNDVVTVESLATPIKINGEITGFLGSVKRVE